MRQRAFFMRRKLLFIGSVVILCQVIHGQRTDADLEYIFNKAQDFHYINKDSAYTYYEKTISLSDSLNNLDYFFMGHSYLINANGHYYDLPRYKRNIGRLDSVLKYDRRVDHFEWADYYRNYMLFDKGNYYYKTKEYTTSKKYFLELYNKIERATRDGIYIYDIEMLSSINSFLGLINYHTGKYEQAEYTYRRDIELVRKHSDSLDDWQSSIMSSKKLLSQVYEVQNRKEEANSLLNEALEYYSVHAKDPSYSNSYHSTLMLLAKNLCKQEEYQKALDLLDNREDLAQYPFFQEVRFIEGDAYLGQHKTSQALAKYEDGLSAYLEYRQHRPHQDIAMAYAKMVEFYIDQGAYDKGIPYLLEAFNASGANIKLSTLLENPSPQEVFSKRQLLHLLHLKLKLLQSSSLREDTKKYPLALIQTNQDLMVTFDLLKKEFESKLDKQFLAETAYPIFHTMLAATYDLYQNEPSSELLELALNISERNKDFLLLEALRNANATIYGGVPNAVLEKEAQYRAAITNAEKDIFDAQALESDISEQLPALKQEYYAFLDTIKRKYPKYHDLKYSTNVLDLKIMRQEILENDEALISYTSTTEHLYVITVDGSKEKFLKLPFDQKDRKQVRDFYRLISQPTAGVEINEIERSAEDIFNTILKEPLKGFKADDLAIIPDGVLHYLPFDILRQNKQYLLKTKRISYMNSANSMLELKAQKDQSEKELLAFAPSFDQQMSQTEERKFGKLRYNVEEVEKISAFYDADVFLKANSSVANFFKEASKFKVIHLATHASANDQFPDFSYLAFSESGTENSILYIKDLYNMVLNAQMVTLSACQTGIGKLQKGQGMMSLSKGFFYAGAKSLVNTLWKINDKSTVKLMQYFYEDLSKGKSKKEALRNAKLKYLETTDDALLRHPYYWAAFTVSGDPGPISEQTSTWWIVVLAILAFVIMGWVVRGNAFKKID